jgi:hypothetical protein
MNRNNQQAKRELIAAAKSGDLGAVRAALARWEGPAQPYQQKPLGEALIEAIKNDHDLVAVYLLDHGARTRGAQSARYPNRQGSAIAAAALRNNLDMIRLLLARSDDFEPWELNHPLIVTAARGETELVGRLLNLGANPDSESGEALRLACYRGHLETARLLLSRGASPRFVDRSILARRRRKKAFDKAAHRQLVEMLEAAGWPPANPRRGLVRVGNPPPEKKSLWERLTSPFRY